MADITIKKLLYKNKIILIMKEYRNRRMGFGLKLNLICRFINFDRGFKY